MSVNQILATGVVIVVSTVYILGVINSAEDFLFLVLPSIVLITVAAFVASALKTSSLVIFTSWGVAVGATVSSAFVFMFNYGNKIIVGLVGNILGSIFGISFSLAAILFILVISLFVSDNVKEGKSTAWIFWGTIVAALVLVFFTFGGLAWIQTGTWPILVIR